MRRLLAWIAGAVGGVAAYRLVTWRRGRAALEPPAPAAEVDPRAEALRAKLDEAREPEAAEDEATPSPAVSSATAPEAVEPVVDDADARRQAVHEHGRAAVEEMRGGEEASEEPQ
jgi:hypothetical protein